MFTATIVLIIIVCVLLVLIVLVQNPKGGGLSSTFGGANQFMGVRKTTDFLEKASWTLASVLMVLCVLAALLKPKSTVESSALQEKVNLIPTTQTTPDFGNTIPAENPDQAEETK